MCELILNGRQIIPVRMIPFVTGLWPIDTVASILACNDGTFGVSITSHRLMPKRKWKPMLPKEWDACDTKIVALSHLLNPQQEPAHANYPKWEQQSLEILHPGCFVWWEDLLAAYPKCFEAGVGPMGELSGDYEFGYKPYMDLMDERKGDRKLVFPPVIPENLRELVFEGFEVLLPKKLRAKANGEPKDQAKSYQPSTLRRESRKLDTQDLYKEWDKLFRQYEKKHSKPSFNWMATQVARMKIPQGCTSGHIAKMVRNLRKKKAR